MLARLSALVIWGLVAATLAYWGLALWGRSSAVPANAVVVGDAPPRGDLARLFGAPRADAEDAPEIPPEAAARFRLVGVMAPKRRGDREAPPSYGVALIQVDDKPPRAYAVGSRLEGDLVLQSVSLRGAALGPANGAPALKLELPVLPPPAIGSLPGMGANGVPGGAGNNYGIPPRGMPGAPMTRFPVPAQVPPPQEQVPADGTNPSPTD